MIHVVAGETGEYSDSTVWYVRAFTNKQRAEQFAEGLNQWCKDHACEMSDGSRYKGQDKPNDDPQFQSDYTGTQYSVIEIPLDEAAKLRFSAER